MRGLRFLLFIFLISHLSAMKNYEEDFPDPKKEWWFEKLPVRLQEMAFSWEEQGGELYVLTQTLKAISLKPYFEKKVKKDA